MDCGAALRAACPDCHATCSCLVGCLPTVMCVSCKVCVLITSFVACAWLGHAPTRQLYQFYMGVPKTARMEQLSTHFYKGVWRLRLGYTPHYSATEYVQSVAGVHWGCLACRMGSQHSQRACLVQLPSSPTHSAAPLPRGALCPCSNGLRGGRERPAAERRPRRLPQHPLQFCLHVPRGGRRQHPAGGEVHCGRKKEYLAWYSASPPFLSCLFEA